MSAKERLQALLVELVQDVDALKPVRPFVEPLLRSALAQVSEEQVVQALIFFRDKAIPWLLGDGDGSDRAE